MRSADHAPSRPHRQGGVGLVIERGGGAQGSVCIHAEEVVVIGSADQGEGQGVAGPDPPR